MKLFPAKDVSLSKEKVLDADLIRWLATQPLYPKFFWREKHSGVTRAAVGNLLTFPSPPELDRDSPVDLCFYGGMDFSKRIHQDKCWEKFPTSRFWLPLIERVQEAGATTEKHYAIKGKTHTSNPLPSFPHTSMPTSSLPDYTQWCKEVETIKEQIAADHLKKVVLARRTSYPLKEPISIWPLLDHLCSIAPTTTVFAFCLSEHLCFLGATPERLFSREGDLLTTEAIAGTRSLGTTPAEQQTLTEELLSSTKDREEFLIVKEHIHSALTPLSNTLEWQPTDSILKTSNLQHLYNSLRAKLKDKVSDRNLIAALHPTAALGGYPRNRALDFLSRNEPFDRGWYGAPIGIITPGRSSFYVGIRSMLHVENALHFFAGAGIVKESIAKNEWEELDYKISPFTKYFYAK